MAWRRRRGCAGPPRPSPPPCPVRPSLQTRGKPLAYGESLALLRGLGDLQFHSGCGKSKRSWGSRGRQKRKVSSEIGKRKSATFYSYLSPLGPHLPHINLPLLTTLMWLRSHRGYFRLSLVPWIEKVGSPPVSLFH